MRVPQDSIACPLSTFESVLCEGPETGLAWGTNCGVGQWWWVVGLCWTSGWLMWVRTTEADGCRVTIHKVWEQTFRLALYKTDTANQHLAMSGLFSDLAWLSECQTDKNRTNLPEYCAELKCLNSEHKERKNLTHGIWSKAGLWCYCSLLDGPIEPAWWEEWHWKSQEKVRSTVTLLDVVVAGPRRTFAVPAVET